MKTEWDALVGETVVALYLTDQQELVFACASGKVLHAAMNSDCCSDSWIGDVVNAPSLLGATVAAVTVLDVERTDLPARCFDDTRTHQESEQYFGFDVRTNKGNCTIVARNSSNGYYGGDFNKLVELATVPDRCRPLTDDYQG